jgi:hypothetical protein
LGCCQPAWERSKTGAAPLLLEVLLLLELPPLHPPPLELLLVLLLLLPPSQPKAKHTRVNTQKITNTCLTFCIDSSILSCFYAHAFITGQRFLSMHDPPADSSSHTDTVAKKTNSFLGGISRGDVSFIRKGLAQGQAHFC